MNKSRKLKLKSIYTPFPINEDDDVFRNGIFQFNITKILEQIHNGKLLPKKEQVHVQDWFNSRFHGSINEDHLPSVDVTKRMIRISEWRNLKVGIPDSCELIYTHHVKLLFLT
ncbi:hypothetical protein SAMN05216225_101344 [Ornithinibacillus halophilus]|uniref:Uncharacterized protein n=1 Tax=Ornithinibacillus halophilus TaxID=930117 RepID=A0A1M5GKM1_9BACI|nr:hypothetical protein SAMN05216225_101344 [Ornithinibacillus halophilus]